MQDWTCAAQESPVHAGIGIDSMQSCYDRVL